MIKVTSIQTHLYWESPSENLIAFENLLKNLPQTDLVLLPEMFTTGFSMNVNELAESVNSSVTIQWLKNQAQLNNFAIAGSLISEENGCFYNRLIFMPPDGHYSFYDKRHLFSFANEDKHFSKGNKKLIIEWRGWKLCFLICYDLRFPVWSRNQEGYDLLIFVANWPMPRINAWKTLLSARAIENQSYVVGVNRTGVDAKGQIYNGFTSFFRYDGNLIYQSDSVNDSFTTFLSLVKQNAFRERFRFLDDRDQFEIIK